MNTFGYSAEEPSTALQRFELDADAVYSLEVTASLSQLTRRLVAIYYKYGLVAPAMDPNSGWYFDQEAIRTLRRIQYLRDSYGINLAGIRLIIDLGREVEQLQGELDVWRGWDLELHQPPKS
jgi:DNA-binding transcriptional MerR regulator